MRLANKVALITAADHGVGRASARLFAKQGAAVAVASENDPAGRAVAE